jgi:hypothetical protein
VSDNEDSVSDQMPNSQLEVWKPIQIYSISWWFLDLLRDKVFNIVDTHVKSPEPLFVAPNSIARTCLSK